jgi:hypothetical protein
MSEFWGISFSRISLIRFFKLQKKRFLEKGGKTEKFPGRSHHAFKMRRGSISAA